MRLYGSMKIQDNILTIGKVNTQKIVKEFGTPLIVLDEEEIRQNIRDYTRALEDYPAESRVLYASKALANRTLYRILAQEGISLDVVSGGELYTALEADFPRKKLFFHGNNKLPDEIDMGLNNKIGGFFIDNFQEAALLEKMAGQRNQKIRALLRLKPGLEAHTHDFMVTGRDDSKFGVGINDGKALELVQKIIEEYDHIELTGIHAHIGSQIYEKQAYIKLIEIMISFLEKVRDETGYTLKDLDLGGGLGIPQTESDPEVSIASFMKIIIREIIRETKERDYPLPRLLIEPGRSIVGTAGTTLYTVGMIKDIENIKKYVTIDGGMTDNIRPSLYGAEYEAFLANRCNEEACEKVTIAGKCCESGDILIEDLQIPPVQSGDILAVPCTGAYTYALSNNYNGIPRPAIVLVKNGEINLIKERENYSDLLRGDIIPEGY